VKFFAGSSTILDRIKIEKGMIIADIGCGPGRISIPAASRVGDTGKIVALDIQEKMLKKLKDRMDKCGIKNIQPILGGIGNGLLKPYTFDRAILVTVLGEIPDKAQAIREIYNILKPGGLLSITELLPDPHYMSKKKVLNLAESQGFSFDRFYGNIISYTINFLKPT